MKNYQIDEAAIYDYMQQFSRDGVLCLYYKKRELEICQW